MKSPTRFVSFVCTILLLVSGLGFAGGQKESAAATGGPQPAKITFWFPSENPANDAYYSGAARDFMAKNPNIQIDVTPIPSNAGDIETKLNAALLSNTFPDVFLAYLVFIGTRGSRGDFAELDSYINNWSEKSDIYPSSLEMGKYKGHYVGLGFAPAPDILTYRKDYFQEAGIDPNKPPTTWEQLADYAVRLTKRDSDGNVIRAGFDMPAISPALVFVEPFFRQNGSQVIDEVNQVPAFADQASIDALQYLVNLYKKNVSIPYNFQKSDTVPFMSGKSAMSYISPSQIASLIQADPTVADKLGYAPVMGRKKKVDFSGYRLFTIGAKSKEKDASWKFIEFLMSSDQVWKRYTDLKIPVVLNSLKDKFVQDNPKFNSILVDYVQHGKGKAVVPWTSLANKYMALAYEEAITGKKSPANALQDAQAALEKELSKSN